ncbi:MAG: hypothetical protein KAS53_00895 [Candidatus Cloacimonetes bacterium]|nr:hypothetical protein [Candidatus Cloacimonadota bacterium]
MKRKSYTYQVQSTLEASCEEVWTQVFQMEGVNAELSPWMKMTYPLEMNRFDPEMTPIGKLVFRSTILVFGLIPIDYYNLSFVKIDSPTQFHEQSSSIGFKKWTHIRTLETVERGCRLTDKVEYEPRIPILGGALHPVFLGLFKHRQKYLRKKFGYLNEPGDTEI